MLLVPSSVNPLPLATRPLGRVRHLPLWGAPQALAEVNPSHRWLTRIMTRSFGVGRYVEKNEAVPLPSGRRLLRMAQLARRAMSPVP